MTEAERRGLLLLHRWKGVRPGSHWLGLPTATLEEAGWVRRVKTALGSGLILSAQGARALGQSPYLTTENVAANALYQQDAWEQLKELGFTALTPGKRPYRTAHRGSKRYPLIGKYTDRGYTRKSINEHYQRLEPDLLTKGVSLLVLSPRPLEFTGCPKLQLVVVEPQWQ